MAGERGIELHALPVDSGWPEAFEQAAKAAGRHAVKSEQDACPRSSLEGGWEGYLASISGKLRHEIRRRELRLNKGARRSISCAAASLISTGSAQPTCRSFRSSSID
jgi:hypothetical protein